MKHRITICSFLIFSTWFSGSLQAESSVAGISYVSASIQATARVLEPIGMVLNNRNTGNSNSPSSRISGVLWTRPGRTTAITIDAPRRFHREYRLAGTRIEKTILELNRQLASVRADAGWVYASRPHQNCTLTIVSTGD